MIYACQVQNIHWLSQLATCMQLHSKNLLGHIIMIFIEVQRLMNFLQEMRMAISTYTNVMSTQIKRREILQLPQLT